MPPSTRLPDEPMVAYTGRITLFSKDFQRNHEKILAKTLAHARNIKPNIAVSIKLKEGEPALEIVDEEKQAGLGWSWSGIRGWVESKSFSWVVSAKKLRI